jgi:predicted Zn-ribbon and HTH transcriptional regulator
MEEKNWLVYLALLLMGTIIVIEALALVVVLRKRQTISKPERLPKPLERAFEKVHIINLKCSKCNSIFAVEATQKIIKCPHCGAE